MTHAPIADTYARITAKEKGWQAMEEAEAEAFELHRRTGEAVQVATYEGIVVGFIREDGCTFGSLATFG